MVKFGFSLRLSFWRLQQAQQMQQKKFLTKYVYKAKSLSWNGTWVETGAFPWRVGGANSACGSLSGARFTHAVCHCFNSGTLPCNKKSFGIWKRRAYILDFSLFSKFFLEADLWRGHHGLNGNGNFVIKRSAPAKFLFAVILPLF